MGSEAIQHSERVRSKMVKAPATKGPASSIVTAFLGYGGSRAPDRGPTTWIAWRRVGPPALVPRLEMVHTDTKISNLARAESALIEARNFPAWSILGWSMSGPRARMV